MVDCYTCQKLFNYLYNSPLLAATPWSSLPVLEVDGKRIGQSLACTRYAAKLAKLTGSNDIEFAQLDAIVDAINDFRGKPFEVMYAADDKKVVKIIVALSLYTYNTSYLCLIFT